MLSEEFLKQVKEDTKEVLGEVLELSKLEAGDLFVLGCSSSEICGEMIGTGSSLPAAQAFFDQVYEELSKRGILVAAQCCEHLNRALIVEKETAKKFGLEIVNVVPVPKAGGSLATTAYDRFQKPVAVENLKAMASGGMDVGGTMIGMHIHPVAVPLHLKKKEIGKARVVAAKYRPKFVGGDRANYNQELM